MTTEYGIVAYVDSSGSTAGAREFRRSADDIGKSAGKMTGEIKKTQNQLFGLGETLRTIKGMLLGFAAGFTLMSAIGQISEFETSMAKLGGLIGNNKEEMKMLEVTARELGATTVFSAGEAAQAMIELTKAGFSARQSIAATRDVLNLAAAEQLGLAEAAEITAITLAQFQMNASDAGRATNVLSKMANASQTDVRQLAEGLSYAGNIAHGLGLDIETTAAAMGVLSDAGLQGSMAGTALRTSLSALLTPSKKAAEAMAELGVDFKTIKATLAEENGFPKLVENLAAKFNAIPDPVRRSALAFEIFGDKGAGAMLALSSNVDSLDKYLTRARDTENATQDMADAMGNTLKGSLAELASAFEELVLQIGDSGARGAIRGLLDGVGALMRGLSGMKEEGKLVTDGMVTMNNIGQALRNNIELIKDAVIVLASVFVGRWLSALTMGAVAVARQTALNVALAASWRTVAAGAGSASVAMQAAAVAGGALRAIVATLGGPVGLITIAAGALYLFATNADQAKVSAQDLGDELDRLKAKWINASKAQREFLLTDAEANMVKTSDKIFDLQRRIADAEKANAAAARNKGSTYGSVMGGGMGGGGGASAIAAMGSTAGAMSSKELYEARKELANLNAEVNRYAVTINAMKSGNLGVADTFKDVAIAADAAAGADGAGGGVSGVSKEMTEAEKAAKEFASTVEGLIKELNPLAAAFNENKQKLEALKKLQGMSAKELENFGLTADTVKLMVDQLGKSYQENLDKLHPMHDRLVALGDRYKDLRKEQQPLVVAEEEHAKVLKEIADAMALGDVELAKRGLSIAKLTELQKMANVEYKKTTEEIKNQGKESNNWQKIMEQSIKRVDDAFVDLWKSAFDGFDDFADAVLDTFKNLLAEMMHAATTRKLTNWFSEFLGTGGAGSGNGSGGIMDVIGGLFKGNGSGGNGLISSITNAFKGWLGMGSGASGAASSMGSYISGGMWQGMGGMAGFGSSASAGYGVLQTGMGGAGTTATGATSALASMGTAIPIIGAVIAGMMANDKFFKEGWETKGQEMDIMKSAAKGTMLGVPLFGMGAVGAIGGVMMVDKLLRGIGLSDRMASLISGSSVIARAFGHKKPTVQASGIDGTLSMDGFSGEQWADIKAKGGWFRSDKHWTERSALTKETTSFFDAATKDVRKLMREAGTLVDDETEKAILAIKVTTGKFTLDKDPEKARKQLEELAAKLRNDMAEAAIKAMDFGSLLKDPDNTFDSVDLLQVITEFLKMIKEDSVEAAKEIFADSQLTGWQSYKKQLAEFNALEYDGSVASLTKLIDATANLKQVQQELTLSYLQTAKAAKEMFGDTAQGIRESTMTDEELYATRQSQIQALVGQMQNELDPTRLMELAREINSLTQSAWGMLDEDQRTELQGGFLSFLDEVDAILQARVGTGLGQLEQDSAAVNAEAADKLHTASENFGTAVDNFNTGVNNLNDILNRLRTGGGGNTTNEMVQLR